MFAREYLSREFPGHDPDNLIDQLAIPLPDADFDGAAHTLNAIARALLEQIARGSAPEASIATWVIDDTALEQHGSFRPVQWSVFWVGLVIALRVDSLELGTEHGVKVIFNNSNTAAIVQMLADVIPNAIENLGGAIDTAKKRLNQIDAKPDK